MLQQQQQMEHSVSVADECFANGRYQEALVQFDVALGCLRAMRIVRGLKVQHCMFGMAESYLRLHDADSAFASLERTFYIEKIGCPRLVELLIETANSFANNNRSDETWKTYWTTLTISSSFISEGDALEQKLNALHAELKEKCPVRAAPLSTTSAALDEIKTPGETRASTYKVPPADSAVSSTESMRSVDAQRSTSQRAKRPVRDARLQKQRNSGDVQQDKTLQNKPSSITANLEKIDLSRLAEWPKLQLLLSIMLLFCCIGLFDSFVSQLKENSQGTAIKSLDGKRFAACDGTTSISFTSDSDCVIDRPDVFSKQLLKKYALVADVKQALPLALGGHLGGDERSYVYANDEVSTDDNVNLYEDGAPEQRVVRQMWWYADFAHQYYQQHHEYPSDTEKCRQSNSNYKYLNPFTDKSDYCAIVKIKGNSTAIFDTRQAIERHWRPGAIFCVCTE